MSSGIPHFSKIDKLKVHTHTAFWGATSMIDISMLCQCPGQRDICMTLGSTWNRKVIPHREGYIG
eukprot:6241065-Pyramimonas_sp.AAC.1